MHTLAATQNSMPQHCWPGRCAAARAAARAERALSPRAELRSARARFKKGQLSAADYEKHINEYMQYAIREQERIGLDVLVHGEPERTDMCAAPPGTARHGGGAQLKEKDGRPLGAPAQTCPHAAARID